MTTQKFEAEIPEGTHLGFAQSPEGGMRGLLFDNETNELIGHAQFFEVAEGDQADEGHPDSPLVDDDAVVAAIAVALAALAAYAAAPYVKQWLNEKAASALETARDRVKESFKKRTKRMTDSSDPTNDVELSDPSFAPTITSDEARRRFAEAVGATAFAQAQMDFLGRATVTDDDGSLARLTSLSQLTPQHVEEAIQLLLEADPSLLERVGLASLESGSPFPELTVAPRLADDRQLKPVMIRTVEEPRATSESGLRRLERWQVDE